ncbi:MAG: hypothetical protein GY851_20900, partial [bacterium]|nr:hypothetical protein [bacterium]
PMTVRKGDALEFTCLAPVGCYRIYDLVFAKQRILPPQPSFEYIETWSTRPGDVDVCWTTTGIVGTGRVEYETADSRRKSVASSAEGRNHRIRLRGLEAAAQYEGRSVTTWQGEELSSQPFSFRAAPDKPAATKAQTIDLVVSEPTNAARQSWPATVGMPFSRGALANVGDLRLSNPRGDDVPLQAIPTSLWHDGSVKWATLSFLADSRAEGKSRPYRLTTKSGDATEATDATPVLTVAESSEAWGLSTSTLSFTVGKKGATFFGRFGFDENGDGVIGPDERVTGSDMSGLVLETGDGQVWTCAAPDTVDVEENGPVRAVVRCAGAMRGNDNGEGWRYLVRLTFTKGMGGMTVNLSVWHGEEEPLFQRIRRLSVDVPLASGDGLRGAFQGDAPADLTDGTSLRLFQDSDAHYVQSCGADVKEGERALGLATVSQGDGTMSLLVRDFWQMYPSALEVDAKGVQVDLLPALAPDAYTVENSDNWFHRLYQWFEDGCHLMRAGQTTQHEFHLWFDKDGVGESAAQCAAWFAEPLLPQASPEYLCSTGVVGDAVFPKTSGVWDSYESFFDGGFEGLTKARESNHMYGWMNFGDWYGERGYNAGNNEYDLGWCLGMQWMRTGDRRLFTRGLEMARHYATVDTIRGEWTEEHPGVV